MTVLDHWHPVVLSAELGKKPRLAELHGQRIVLFRTASGSVGALDEVCPHRGMGLSRGRVVGEQLMCPYHGWRYDCVGAGESPGTPKLHARTTAYDAIERYGAVWIRGQTEQGKEEPSAAAIPRLEFEGYRAVSTLHETVGVPLELLLDNFTEVEHTPTTHAFLGYSAERMPEVETRVTTGEDWVRVYNAGPQKKLPRLLERFVGVYTEDTFVDDWTTYFSPVYSVYDQYWIDPGTGETRPDKLKIAVFFNPLDAERTDLVAFIFTTAPLFGRLGLNAVLLAPLLKYLVLHEIKLDKAMVEQLVDRRVDMQGKKLSRFDRPMGEHRRRIRRLYRGERDA